MKPFSRSTFLSKLLLILIIAWVFLALLRTGYNLYKVYEEWELLHLSDKEKKSRHFGSSYDLMQHTLSVADKSDVVGFYSDGREFYLGRYELYPTHALWLKSGEEVIEAVKKRKIDYLFVYPVELFPDGGRLGLKEVHRTGDMRGILYKI